MEPRKIGIKGEKLARNYLVDEGYKILDRNFRYKRGEIDIIAQRNDLLVFVEVKARTNTHFGLPETFVSDKQAAQIVEVADHYIDQTGWNGPIRFDIISIILKTTPEITYFKDAFH